MLFGAHCSGGIKGALDRAIEIGADAVQLFAQSPRTWRFPEHAEEDLARFRERRAEAGFGAVLVHALYLCNLATPDRTIYGKSRATMRSTVDAACAIEADGVVFHVGSHLGAGFEAGLKRCVPALREVLDRCSDTTWLLLENSAGRRRHDRPLDRRARDPRRCARPPPAARHLPRLVPPLRLGRRRRRSRRGGRDARRRRRPDRARPASRAARERRGGAARLEPRPARERARGRARRAASAPSSRTRPSRACRR